MDRHNTNKKKSFEIFWVLFKIGAFTFGGGWSIIAQMQKEFVEKRGWIDGDELLELISVAKSLPGIMIVNFAVMFGYNVGGVICGFAAALGIVLPSIIILTIVTFFYDLIRSNLYIAKALVGIRAAVIPIILSAVVTLKKSAIADYTCYIVAAIAAGVCLFTNINNLLIVVFGGVAGYLLKNAKLKGEQ